MLALDHDLQIASSATGTVSVMDPAGTKVAFWDQVSLDEGNIFILCRYHFLIKIPFAGVKSFNLPLSEFVRFGRWSIHVEVQGNEFTAPIEVAPGAGGGIPDVAAAEEHYVELRFGREMRRRYKPGLPFSGKVHHHI